MMCMSLMLAALSGMVSVTDVPYRELTEAMKTVAAEMYRR